MALGKLRGGQSPRPLNHMEHGREEPGQNQFPLVHNVLSCINLGSHPARGFQLTDAEVCQCFLLRQGALGCSPGFRINECQMNWSKELQPGL